MKALRSGWHQGWLKGLLLIAGTFLAYQPVWHAGFILDDDVFLVENPLIKASNGLYRFWCTTAPQDYFPMTSTALWLEWRLWGKSPLGYHVINVLLHAVSAVVWWRTLARLIPQDGTVAWVVAAIFAVHPVNVESVAWITERKNTLAMVFYALTLLWYVRFEDTGQRRWYWLAAGGFVLALLSKTAVVMLPLVLLGLAWWRRGRVERRDVWRSIPFFCVAVALGLVTAWFQSHRVIGSTIVRSDNFGARLAGAGWAAWFYFYKAVLPVDLMFVYPRWRIDGAAVLSYVPGLLVVMVLLAGWYYRRRWGKAVLFGLGYFVVMLLPVLGFLDINYMRYSFVADRWQYFSIMGPIGLVTAGMTVALCRLGKAGRFVGPAVGAAALVTLSVLTWRQCGIYVDVETLWQATLARNPDCYLAHNNLGAVLLRKGHMDEAIVHFQKAVEAQPGFADAQYDLGTLMLQKGRVDEAVTHFQRAVEIQPNFAEAHYNLGVALVQKGQLDDAMTQFQKVVEIQPDYAQGHNNLGLALLQKGRVEEAMTQFQKALEIQPDYPKAHYNLGNSLFQTGRREEAVVHFKKALEIEPQNAEIHLTLGDISLQARQLDDAIAHFQKAVDLQPDNARAYNNLGNALLQVGRSKAAVVCFRKALEIEPRNGAVQNNLAWVLATSPEASIRDGSKAIELAREANQLSGGENPLLLRTLAAAYAEVGRFAEAITTAHQALQLATAQTNTALANVLQSQIELYRADTPSRDASLTNAPVSTTPP